MKNVTTLALSALTAGLWATGCGGGAAALDVDDASSVTSAIINGDQCDEATEPTAVAIMIDASVDFGQGEPFEITQASCTGTLIAPDVVLLAAHCLDLSTLTFGFGEVQRADFYVSFEADLSRFAGEQSLPIPESAIPTAGQVVHPDFDLNALGQGTAGVESDIALLFLAAPVEDVIPEVVITDAEGDQLADGGAVTIAGWGQQVATSGPFEPPPAGRWASRSAARPPSRSSARPSCRSATPPSRPASATATPAVRPTPRSRRRRRSSAASSVSRAAPMTRATARRAASTPASTSTLAGSTTR